MKDIFWVTFFNIVTSFAPCPDKNTQCLVNHGLVTDTIKQTDLVFDSVELKEYISKYQVLKIDTAYAKHGCFQID